MKLPEYVKDAIRAFAARYPVPTTNDEDAAAWTHKLCEQLAHSFPYDLWGHKSAGPGRPHSADCIAIYTPFVGWDIVFSAGSPQSKLVLDGDSIDLTGQVYEQVTPTNHLAAEQTPVPPEGTPQPPTPQEPPSAPPDCQALVGEKLDGIVAELRAQRESLDALVAFLKTGSIKLRF